MENQITLQSLIENMATYDRRLVTIIFQKEGKQVKTYGDLGKDIQLLAAGFKLNGMKQGQNCVLLANNSNEWIVTALAVIKAGGVLVPVDVQHDEDILDHILQDSDADFVFTSSEQLERLKNVSISLDKIYLLDVDEQHEQSWRRLFIDQDVSHAPIQPEAPAVLFYTSGTTGFPKGVPLTHANLVFQVNAVKGTGFISDNDRLLLALPLHHVYPFVIGMLSPLMIGAAIVMPQSITGPQIIRTLKEGEITFVLGVPRLYRVLYEGILTRLKSKGKIAIFIFNMMMYISLLMRRLFGWHMGKKLFAPLHQQLGKNVKIMGSGGSALDADLQWKLEGLGWQVAIGYGLTETSPLLTMNLPGQAPIGSVGPPVPGVDIRIDEHGEILARGPGTFAGYRHLPEETKKAFTKEGWLHTGDLGHFDQHGNLSITGRASTVIVTEGGKNVQPDEPEEMYQQDPFIREIGVLEKEHNLVAVILPDTDIIQQQGLDIEKAVHEAVTRQSKKIPSYKRIHHYVITQESIPRTRLGKICRHLLPECYDHAREEIGPHKKPISFEKMSDQDKAILENADVRKLWDRLCDQYQDERLTPDTRLLDLGIDSLGWVDLTLDIAQHIGIEISDGAAKQIETVRDLLNEVADQSQRGRQITQTMLIQNPEEILSEQQKRWLKPVGMIGIMFSYLLYGLIWLIIKGVFRLQVRGIEKLPKDVAYVITPNHVSYLDPFAVGVALGWRRLRQTYWAGWTGVAFVNVWTRLFSRITQVVPIDPKRASVSSLAFGATVLKQGKNMVWFPEGTRSRSGQLIPFKPGLGVLLSYYKVPVVPVKISGAYAAWPAQQRWPRPRIITVEFMQPLPPEEIASHATQDNRPEAITEFLYDHMKNIDLPPES